MTVDPEKYKMVSKRQIALNSPAIWRDFASD
jgi:hypothetical protein